MADDVTKKDLQVLQAILNKQIADVKKQIDEQRTKFNKDLEEENSITVRVRSDLDKRIDEIALKVSALQSAVSNLAKAIGEIASKLSR